MRMKRVTTAITAIALCSGSVAAAASAPGSAPEPASESVQAPNQLNGNPFGIILAVIFAAAVLYGIYDVLIQGDNNSPRPASP